MMNKGGGGGHHHNNPLQRYTKLERIGHGSFGEVFKGLDNHTGETIAIKAVNLENDPEGIEEIRKEIGVLSNCDSPNIIRYRGSYLVGTRLWIIMDYCALGSFRQFIDSMGPLDENSVLFIAREVLLALSYLHSNNIIHRDIKAANILLTDKGEVKLGDFGVASQVLNNFRRNSFVGSPYWMAPEVIKRSQYDSKADIWSLGISLYELLKGSPPLANIEPARAIFIIPKNAPPRLDSSFSQPIRDLVNNCLHDDPQKRPSADELLKCKTFRGIKRGGISQLAPIVEIYCQKKTSQERQATTTTTTTATGDCQSSIITMTNDEECGTIKSATWTFGTYKSEDYENESFTKDKDLIDEEEEGQGDFDEIGNSTFPPNSINNSQSRESFLDGDNGPLVRNSSLSDDSLENANSSLEKSFSSYSFASNNEMVPTKSQAQVPNQLQVHQSNRAQNPTRLHHRKQPSLLSLSLDGGGGGNDDPLKYLDELYLKQTANRMERLQLYNWPFNVTEDGKGGGAFQVYKVMTMLKQALYELPTVSDPRSSIIDLDRKLKEHYGYSERYFTLMVKALKILDEAALASHQS